jgi:hypothetical protein
LAISSIVKACGSGCADSSAKVSKALSAYFIFCVIMAKT